MIRARNLGRVYATVSGEAVRALDGVDLEIGEGEFVCLVGPSGCGKSTFLRIAAGLDAATSGELTLAGKRVAGPWSEVGVVFQSANLLPWFTVLGNVTLPLRVGGSHLNGAGEARAKNLLDMAGIAEFGNKYPYELSGGMQQRAAIVRALARDPKVLLMDEPFGALDAMTRDRLNVELLRIWKASGKTVLLITHSISEAVFLADRVAVFSARPGTIKEVISVDESHPRNPHFVTTEKFAKLRNTLYGLLHDEIRKAVEQSAVVGPAP